VHTPTSAQLWNNIGMCFSGKGKHVAAVACLKRAQYLDPFQWEVAHNLGMVYLRAECYASAFLYLNAAATMNPQNPETLMYLAVTLARLEDQGNSKAAYEKAVDVVAGASPATQARLFINYAVSMFNCGEVAEARRLWKRLECLPEVRRFLSRTPFFSPFSLQVLIHALEPNLHTRQTSYKCDHELTTLREALRSALATTSFPGSPTKDMKKHDVETK